MTENDSFGMSISDRSKAKKTLFEKKALHQRRTPTSTETSLSLMNDLKGIEKAWLFTMIDVDKSGLFHFQMTEDHESENLFHLLR